VLDSVGRSPDDSAFWHDWVSKYDYVYLLFTDEDSDNPAPDKLKTLFEGENFQLYHVIRPGMDPNELNPGKAAKAVKSPGMAPVAPPAAQAAAPEPAKP
jgi:hypothetical protein